ncbi:MAG TPA: dienelactone hydrolase family protein [Acidimicrobiales bacterium]|nr:dienelactone hydrolase family protein [Acidimicrobiales bacterium]
MRSRSIVAPLGALLAALTMVFAGLVVSPSGAGAQTTNPYQRGPDPTEASITATRGPYATSQTTVSSWVAGFGGGTIYYPTTTSDGTFGAVAMAPGFTATQSSLAWLGPRVASQGFVVFIIDTNSIYDQPGSRGDQLQAALDYLVERSSVRSRVDRTRLAVSGHSMGGGGTLEAARDNPSLQAAVAYQPWNLTKNFSGIAVPTMIIGAQDDTVAPVSSHSEPFYESIPASSEKAYVELAGASHFVSNTANTPTAKFTIAWLKRYVDNDTRYEQFICPAPRSTSISEYRDTCPG